MYRHLLNVSEECFIPLDSNVPGIDYATGMKLSPFGNVWFESSRLQADDGYGATGELAESGEPLNG